MAVESLGNEKLMTLTVGGKRGFTGLEESGPPTPA